MKNTIVFDIINYFIARYMPDKEINVIDLKLIRNALKANEVKNRKTDPD